MAVNRITGLTSGMDTDKLVKDLMKVEQMKYDKVYKESKQAEWQQEAYRTTIDMLKGFQDKYFDLLTPETNFRSRSTFSAFSSEVKIDGEDVNYVSVSGTSSISSLNHTISSISQLATKDTWNSEKLDIASVMSSEISGTELTSFKSSGIKFNLNIDGVTKEIKIDAGDLTSVNNVDDLISKMNQEIGTQFGSEYSGVVSKTSVGSGEGLKLDVPGGIVKVYGADNSSSMYSFGFTEGQSNTSYKKETLSSLFNITSSAFDDFTINGKKIEGLSYTDTLEDFVTKINRADANVTLSFNSLEDRFILSGTLTGAANDVEFSESSDAMNFFDAIGFDTTGTSGGDGAGGVAYRSSAANAVFNLDGYEVVKASNDFQIDGAKYTLNEVYTDSDPIDVVIKSDTDALITDIKAFVDDYNDLIKKVDILVTERDDPNYQPLTVEEKSSLSEDQIKSWESRAKKGVMFRENNLTLMLDKMRSAFYDKVEGVDTTLTQIGITTSDNYKDKGKLMVDEEKLKIALETDYQSVVSLFTNDSDQKYLDSENSQERYKENGIAERINDILNDVVRTNRDENGKKGTLLEKAGLVDDASEESNYLSLEIKRYDTKLKYMLTQLASKETSYYNMFASMEASLSKLSQQSASLASQFGG